MIASAITIAATCGLLVAEKRGSLRGVVLTKPIAAGGFIAAALTAGALGSSYGIAVLVALCLSFLGDVLLIPRGTGVYFLSGLVAFLLGHVGFSVAFVVKGVDPAWLLAATVVLVPVAVVVARWLLPNVKPGMKRPIIAYVLVITSMAALSVGTFPVAGDYRIPLAAAMFFVSDLTVARHRFVTPGYTNRLLGLPLYFGAQLVFATTV